MQSKYTKRDWLPQAIGLLILLIVAGVMVPCDGKSCDNPNTHYTE
jgi:hypothetical protein